MRVVCEVPGVIYFPIRACRRRCEPKKGKAMRAAASQRDGRSRVSAKRETHFRNHQIDSDALDKLLNYYSTRTSQGNAFCECV